MLFTLDLDDTLRYTQEPEYDAIRYAAADWYGEEDDDVAAFLTEQSDQSSRLYQTWRENGLSPTHWTRFPQATADAYDTLAKDVNEEELGIAYGIGFGAFGNPEYIQEHGFIPGTRKTLTDLSANGDDLVIITTGDEWIQGRKLNALGVHRLVQDGVIADTYVVDDKTGAIVDAIARYDADPAETFHVGNSPRSDGKAAENAGVGWIHVTGDTWEEDMVKEDRVHADYRIRNVEELWDIRPYLL